MVVIRFILVVVRAFLALLWTLAVHYFGVALPGLFSKKRRFLGAIRLWGKGLAIIMGIHVHPVNAKPEMMGDVIISNHMGFLDIPILLQFFPSVFVIKMELRRVPFFGARLAAQGHVFVARANKDSRMAAREGIEGVLKDGDRIIVFPEGKASPGASRLPYAPASFELARRLGKKVQVCVVDYLPDRDLLKWDINKPTIPQLANLLGRVRIDASIRFFPACEVKDAVADAERWRQTTEQQLQQNSNGQ